MNRIAALLGVLVGLLVAAAPARADFFSVSADLPVAASADSTSADSVSGYKLGLSTPFFVGVALENYTAKFKHQVQLSGGGTADLGVTNNLVDVFVNLPIPIINLAAGLGVGRAAIDSGSTKIWDDATLTQYFVSVGMPVLVLFDVHVGYHVFSGSASAKAGRTEAKLKLDGNMISVGAKVGF